MADVDTSAEAVERLALSLLIADQPITAAALRALLARAEVAAALAEWRVVERIEGSSDHE